MCYQRNTYSSEKSRFHFEKSNIASISEYNLDVDFYHFIFSFSIFNIMLRTHNNHNINLHLIIYYQGFPIIFLKLQECPNKEIIKKKYLSLKKLKKYCLVI